MSKILIVVAAVLGAIFGPNSFNLFGPVTIAITPTWVTVILRDGDEPKSSASRAPTLTVESLRSASICRQE